MWRSGSSEAAHHERPFAALYAAWATLSPQGKAKHRHGILFKVPHKLDMHHLVPVEKIENGGLVRLELSSDHCGNATGFNDGRGLILPALWTRRITASSASPGEGQLLDGAQGEDGRV